MVIWERGDGIWHVVVASRFTLWSLHPALRLPPNSPIPPVHDMHLPLVNWSFGSHTTACLWPTFVLLESTLVCQKTCSSRIEWLALCWWCRNKIKAVMKWMTCWQLTCGHVDKGGQRHQGQRNKSPSPRLQPGNDIIDKSGGGDKGVFFGAVALACYDIKSQSKLLLNSHFKYLSTA